MTDDKKTTYDPAEVERLIAEAREEDAQMTPVPWRADSAAGIVFGDGGHVDGAIEVFRMEAESLIADPDAIARTRNNLHALADQLEAARAEIERLPALPDVGVAPGHVPDDLTDDDLSALERDAEHLPSSPITLGEIEPLLVEIRRHRAAQTASVEQVREVVREAFARVSDLSGAEFAQRHIEDIATRVAAQMTAPASEPRA
jgi:hypothetical protein